MLDDRTGRGGRARRVFGSSPRPAGPPGARPIRPRRRSSIEPTPTAALQDGTRNLARHIARNRCQPPPAWHSARAQDVPMGQCDATRESCHEPGPAPPPANLPASLTTDHGDHMNVLFITSVAVVAADPPRSRQLFMDALGLPLEGEGDGYYSSGSIRGSKHFGVWPLSQAAEACFGTPAWPAGRPIPQASIEFEVENADAVASAGGELQRAGFELLHAARTEPWGQTVTRLLTGDGLIIGISYAPSLHEEEPA